VAQRLGIHADRLKDVRALRSVKGRRENSRFAFEGPTLLHEARASGFGLEEIYATQTAYDQTPLVRELEQSGVPTFIVEPASAAQISDLVTPSGIVAIAAIRLATAEQLLAGRPPILVLADVGDPANAGALLRSADAFGCSGVIFGSLGVEPFHPKVVRASMGAVFRLALAVAQPEEVSAKAQAAGVALLGLAAGGGPLSEARWELPSALLVGHERRGLGRWAGCCQSLVGIPMSGQVESLSAAVAGSIALYEATVRPGEPASPSER
jgi:TrmH family RNA methyltransferase